ncbi:MAG TPA: M23 family metallopeptidase [Patescibacteria group bacterium]|nr:M23 family metallopeptidase [Patescibacteria group bacterium]
MAWQSPFPLKLVACASPDDWSRLRADEAMLALPPHSGAFGDRRDRHNHEGVDLYAPAETPVLAVEDGTVVGVTPFSGHATRNDYWRDMEAVMVHGSSGLILYCEFSPSTALAPAMTIRAGTPIGRLYAAGYKFRKPADREEDHAHHAFLHLELHQPQVRLPTTWESGRPQPKTLLDPTPYLLAIAKQF